MNICRKGHEKICYVGANCPLCAIRREIENMIEGYIIELNELRKIVEVAIQEDSK